MSREQEEQEFIQAYQADKFSEYLKEVWRTWPSLRYSQVRRKASRLWKARKEWVKNLEPRLVTTTCIGCRDNELNQLGHMDRGGCLYYLVEE